MLKQRDLRKQAEKILKNNYYNEMTHKQILHEVHILRSSIDCNSRFEDYIDKCFSLCIEATRRVLDKEQYAVQIMSGLALTQGRVIEMKTGEGKTLTELCPAFTRALFGNVHILTVNDYLCARDFSSMKGVFEYLGLTVGLVVSDSSLQDRKEAYSKDVVYSTNVEIGFDYLRDNTSYNKDNIVLQSLDYVLVDEIDSILIDDGKTPLVLSKQSESDLSEINNAYNIANSMPKNMVEYSISENYVIPTEEGLEFIGVEVLENTNSRHLVYQSLKAIYLLKKDIDYIVSDGKIVLIDKNTGRITEDRKLSDGLHQCIEVKEGLEVTEETSTIASIIYQSLFRLYDCLSGMSGTILSEKDEMEEFYSVDVIAIPTNKLSRRKDYKDKIFISKEDKYRELLSNIKDINDKGNPILIGTVDVEESEYISNLLDKEGIVHRLLNAKTKEREAYIISKAGNYKSITIATNMAGRGTDIPIPDTVNSIGGLYVIGTQRNDSRRVDEQLIGRSGRQGNEGVSMFYIGLGDKLLEDSEEFKVTSSNIKKEIIKSQKLNESRNYQERKEIFERDYVISLQREAVYSKRLTILNEDNIEELLFSTIMEDVGSSVITTEKDLEDIYGKYKLRLEIGDKVFDCIKEYYELILSLDLTIEKKIKVLLLNILDEEWINHCKSLELMRKHNNYYSMFMQDSKITYARRAIYQSANTISKVKDRFIRDLFNSNILNIEGD